MMNISMLQTMNWNERKTNLCNAEKIKCTHFRALQDYYKNIKLFAEFATISLTKPYSAVKRLIT